MAYNTGTMGNDMAQYKVGCWGASYTLADFQIYQGSKKG